MNDEVFVQKDAKIIKDPIYGYIEINANILHQIVDTATFQRLRNIRQTSYDPLYPAAVHTRFSHSLGVYYLGTFAANSFRRSFQQHLDEDKDYWGSLADVFDRYQHLFELACLLHDVGHSPFSHTGEKFYKNSKSNIEICIDSKSYKKELRAAETEEEKKEIKDRYQEAKRYTFLKHLAQLTGDSIFQSPSAENPAAHEIMSCIVALESFGDQFTSNDERSFFARCITGLQYKEALKKQAPVDYVKIEDSDHILIRDRALRNCFIQLLHSSVIDVDRLDYIIRDAITIGYQSVSIDYARLLKGVVLVRDDDYSDIFSIGFHKNAISIIENAVYAHDLEKKWVQGHPTILYDSFLIERSIVEIEDAIRKTYPEVQSTLFSFDSLTDEGSCFGENIHVRYLCDADLIHLMKNVFKNSYAEEYFKRDTRPVPVWKSEAEFRSLFQTADRENISNAMRWLVAFTTESTAEISDNTLTKLEQHLEAKPEDTKCRKLHDLLADILKLCDTNGFVRKVIILSASAFTSNFSADKNKVKELPIVFPTVGSRPLKEVSTTLSSDGPEEEKLYYFFYYPNQGREKANTAEFARKLASIFEDHKL